MIAPALTFSRRKVSTHRLTAGRLLAAACLYTLFAFMAPAQAETIACGGKNLLDELKAENPAEYEHVLAESGKVLNGKGIFWKIEKQGLDTSHLLGTMHLSDPRVLDVSLAVEDAEYDAKVVILESDEILDMKKVQAKMLVRQDLYMLPAGKRIEDFLTKEQAETLAAGLKAKGIPMGAVSRMSPWMLSISLSMPGCETIRRARGAKVLDQQIAENAVDEDIPVKGLETFEEQLSAMNSLSVENQVKGLLETIALGDKLKDVIETMIQIYKAGDMGLYEPLLARGGATTVGVTSGEVYSEFVATMLIKRNHVMAERAAPFLTEGGAFIAVGALHLQGEKGLVELFRKQGYTVTAVE